MGIGHFFRKHWAILLFKFRLRAVINRCANKYTHNNTKSTCIVYRWIQRYVNREEAGIDKQTMVTISWATGKLVKDSRREES